MKCIHIRIVADNKDGKFRCKINTDQLEREDCTEFERLIAKDLEEVVIHYVDVLVKACKQKDSTVKYEKTRIE